MTKRNGFIMLISAFIVTAFIGCASAPSVPKEPPVDKKFIGADTALYGVWNDNATPPSFWMFFNDGTAIRNFSDDAKKANPDLKRTTSTWATLNGKISIYSDITTTYTYKTTEDAMTWVLGDKTLTFKKRPQ
jgi:hypothetical protein